MANNLKTTAVGLIGFCAFLALYATQPILPLLRNAFHASELEVSLTISAATIAVALAAPWVGLIADAIGRKRVIVPAVCLLGVATLLAATSTSLSILIFWRFVQGLLTPAVFAVTVAYIAEEWPRNEVGPATAIYVTGTVIGGFAGRFISGNVAALWGWRWVFVVLGGLNLAFAIAAGAWLPSARQFSPVAGFRSGIRNILEHLKNRQLLAIYGVGFCILFSLIGTFTYITFHLAAPPFHLGASALGSIFFVYLIGAVITPLAGRWIDHIEGWVALASALLFSIFGEMLTLIAHLGWVIMGLALCCSGVFICQTITNKSIGIIAGKARALAVGLYVTFYYFGGFVGSVVPSFLWKWRGWPACVIFITLMQFLAIGLVLLFLRKPREKCCSPIAGFQFASNEFHESGKNS